jgi:hypothetical protein
MSKKKLEKLVKEIVAGQVKLFGEDGNIWPVKVA